MGRSPLLPTSKLPLSVKCSPVRLALTAAALAAPVLHAQSGRRAIVVSYDSFNEQRVTATLGASTVPTFAALRADAACTDGARPMFPSLTAASHAAIWTGTWGNRNGIAGNRLMLPPADSVTALTTGDGFRFEHLDAEPGWLAFGRQGKRVVGLHVTQAPDVPGYPWHPARAARRAEAAATLAAPGTWVLNGYNTKVDQARVLTERDAAPRPAAGWQGLAALPADAPPPLEIAWRIGDDSVFALATGAGTGTAAGRYDRLLVAVGRRDLDRAVTVLAHEAEPAALGQPLARHFAPPVAISTPAGRAFARWRLFELSPDGRRFTLFQPDLNVASANRPDVADAHDAAVQGFYGNTASYAWERGRFGPTYRQGGTGLAERRYLETAELAVAGSIAAAEWAWRAGRPDALFTYLAVGDDVDHATWGEAMPAPSVAGDTARVRAARALRAAVWQLADRHLAALRALAAASPGTALLVSSDHGMRGTSNAVRLNLALAQAGLAALDTTVTPRGARTDTTVRLDAARSLAVSPNGYWITVNTTARGGPVAARDVPRILARVERTLRALRAPDGTAIVTGVRRPARADTLGLGGPAGGDLYWDLAPGWRIAGDLRGPITEPAPATGGHGFTSTDDDMQAAFCLWADGVAPRRIARGRIIDVVPTAAEWLGVAPPRDATGRSQLKALGAARDR